MLQNKRLPKGATKPLALMPRLKPKMNGSALLTSLFIMTLVAIVATAMSTRLQLDIYRTRLLVAHDKLYFASQAVMFWAFNELSNKNNKFINIDATGMVSHFPNNMNTLYKGVTITGGLYDLQGKLNLNNLIDKKAIALFINLINRIYPKTNDKDKIGLALAIQDWVSAYDLSKGNDAYMAYYTSQKPPYYPSHQLLKSLSEFRLIKGVNADMAKAIQSYATVLPEPTPLNINTASKPLLMSLGDGLNESQLEELITARGKGFKTMNKLNPLVQKFNIPNNQITIESTYFLSKAYVKNEDLNLTVYVLLKREKNSKGKIKVSVIRQSFNSF
jgi:general secretion pathway protein K